MKRTVAFDLHLQYRNQLKLSPQRCALPNVRLLDRNCALMHRVEQTNLGVRDRWSWINRGMRQPKQNLIRNWEMIFPISSGSRLNAKMSSLKIRARHVWECACDSVRRFHDQAPFFFRAAISLRQILSQQTFMAICSIDEHLGVIFRAQNLGILSNLPKSLELLVAQRCLAC